MALVNESKLFKATATLLLSIITFLAANIYTDVRELKSQVPVINEQIKNLQDDNGRLKNKVFALVYSMPLYATKKEIITFDQLVNKIR